MTAMDWAALRSLSPLSRTFALSALALAISGCIGGSGGNSGGGSSAAQCPAIGNDGNCAGNCAEQDATAFLSPAEVQQVINQALFEATARAGAGLGVTSTTVAVVDRVGNVLGVARLGAGGNVTVTAAPLVRTGGLEGVAVPDTAAAIAKAVTAAYLSSEGNAFSTRTANFIVQEHYPPGVDNVPGGPLYGVQFSQLPCSDLTQKTGVVPTVGPRRSPLGLAADPGGLPLYKNGTPVGGVGVISDGIYGIDRNVNDTTFNDRNQTNAALNNFRNNDEIIALAATNGFNAPVDREATRILADGVQLTFKDAATSDLLSNPGAATDFSANLVAVASYFDGTVETGTRFTTAASGYVAADDNFSPGGAGTRTLDAFVLTEADGTTPRDLDQATGGVQSGPRGGTVLSQGEVTQLLRNAIGVANRAQAQIRRPLCSQARVTVSIVDTNGDILGIARTRDAPIFGTDVSLQKARSALLFSSADAATAITGAGLATDYVTAYRNITSGGTLADGIAFGNRSIGNLARPFFPDGIQDNFRGPFSVEFNANWSPFNVGLQSDLVLAANGLADAPRCTLAGTLGGRLGNGLQIFAGGVPVYKGGVLAGGVGVSGDGIEQDDMIAFLGIHEAGLALGGSVANAPVAQRIDTRDHIVRNAAGGNIGTTRVRYVQCPFQPFIGSTEQNPCNGK